MASYSPPKYFLLKRSLLEKLDNDDLAPGDLLPSERELMDQYGVSRITVRKAIDELEKDGCLYKVQGKGTFVKGGQRRQDLIAITSCTEDVIRQGMTPSRKVLVNDIIVPDKKRRRHLHLFENDMVFRLARIYYADGVPLNHTTAYLPHKYLPGIELYDFSRDSLYNVLKDKYGVKITRAERTMEAVIADDEICRYLQVGAAIPLLFFQCVTYGIVQDKEVPIETFKCHYRSDRFKFCINQVGD